MAFPNTFDLKDGGTVRFRSTNELRAFLENDRERWQWFGPLLDRMANPQDTLAGLRELWNQHRSAIQGSLTHLDQGNLQQAEDNFTNYFVDGFPLPISKSPRAELIDQVRKDISDRAGVGAVAALFGRRFDSNDPEQARGVFVAHEFLSGTGKAARQSVQTGLSNLVQRLGQLQLRAEDKADELDRRIEQTEQRRRRQYVKLLREGDKSWREFKDETALELSEIKAASRAEINAITAEKDAAIASIENTERTYSEHMGLKAPVTYWRKKAVGHRIKGWVSGAIGLGFAVAVIWYGISHGVDWVLGLVRTVNDATHQWQATYAVLGIAAFILTIVFWIGRLISRTFVSESHLTIDAEERAVMVETYLALTQENKIDASERVLVLGALFRPSSDGLVKDDGGPDTGGLAGMLSKVGMGGPIQTR